MSQTTLFRSTPTALPLYLREHHVALFWSKVDKSGECWEWQAYRMPWGYGRFGCADGKTRTAHRISYEMAFGPIPEGLIVCHTCDNPPCVRPKHFFLGSHKDNAQDAVRKRRSPHHANPDSYRHIARETHPMAKLTEADVATIRQLRREGYLLREIGDRFGMSQNQISRIARGEAWK